MSSDTDGKNIFDVSKALDTVQARQTTAAEKHKKKMELAGGKRVEVRHTRPEQLNFKTTSEVRRALARLAKVMNKSRVEVMEIAILSLESAVAPQEEKGKRK
jgi:hypothetical protein